MKPPKGNKLKRQCGKRITMEDLQNDKFMAVIKRALWLPMTADEIYNGMMKARNKER